MPSKTTETFLFFKPKANFFSWIKLKIWPVGLWGVLIMIALVWGLIFFKIDRPSRSKLFPRGTGTLPRPPQLNLLNIAGPGRGGHNYLIA